MLNTLIGVAALVAAWRVSKAVKRTAIEICERKERIGKIDRYYDDVHKAHIHRLMAKHGRLDRLTLALVAVGLTLTILGMAK